MAIDPYAVLRVPPGATPEEVRAAYRRRAFETHPDRNPGTDGAEFRLVVEAYQSLAGGGEPDRSTRAATEASAEASFFDFLCKSALELIATGKTTEEVLAWLRGEGCPDHVAQEIERRLRAVMKAQVRADARRFVVARAILTALLLGVLAVVGLWSPLVAGLGGGLIVLFGGGPLLGSTIIGLYAWATGEHPASYSPESFKIAGWIGFFAAGAIFWAVSGAEGPSPSVSARHALAPVQERTQAPAPQDLEVERQRMAQEMIALAARSADLAKQGPSASLDDLMRIAAEEADLKYRVEQLTYRVAERNGMPIGAGSPVDPICMRTAQCTAPGQWTDVHQCSVGMAELDRIVPAAERAHRARVRARAAELTCDELFKALPLGRYSGVTRRVRPSKSAVVQDFAYSFCAKLAECSPSLSVHEPACAVDLRALDRVTSVDLRKSVRFYAALAARTTCSEWQRYVTGQ